MVGPPTSFACARCRSNRSSAAMRLYLSSFFAGPVGADGGGLPACSLSLCIALSVSIMSRVSYSSGLKLYIYGYLNRVQSSRRLEREAGRNIEVMWLTGRLVPDHKTIA